MDNSTIRPETEQYEFFCDEHGVKAVCVQINGFQILEMEVEEDDRYWVESTFYNDSGPHRIFCNICGRTLGYVDGVEW